MSVTDLISRKRNRDIAVTRSPALTAESCDPFIILHREADKLFDGMWNSFNFNGVFAPPTRPHVDLVEADEDTPSQPSFPGSRTRP